MRMRRIFASALLVSAALTLTACQDEDTADTDASASSSSKPGGDTSATPKGGKGDDTAAGKGGVKFDKDGCPIEAPGHKFIYAEKMEGNVLFAKDGKLSCNREMNEGAFFSPAGKTQQYTILDDAEINPLLLDDDTTSTRTIKHLQVCVAKLADPLGEKPEDPKEKCSGNGPYDIQVDAENNVSVITELITS